MNIVSTATSRHILRAVSLSTLCLTALLNSQAIYANHDTLMDIYDLAKNNDHQLKSEHAQFLADSENANISRSVLRPQISGSAELSKTNADTRGATPIETNTDALNYTVSLTQTLFNRNVWQTYQQSKIETRIAATQYEANKQSLFVRSAEAYFNVLRAIDQQKTAEAEEKAQATLLEQTQQRFDVGLISINDVHETQAAFDSAVANRINNDANVGIQRDALSILTGQLHTSIAPLIENFDVSTPQPSDQQAWVDFAIKNNLTLKTSELEADAARQASKAANSTHLPTLSGAINYTDGNSDIDTVGAGSNRSDTNTTVFNLTLSVPLYTGGKTSALRKQAAQNAIRAHEDFLLTQRKTIQSARSLYLSVTTDIAQIQARKQAIISSTSALESSKTGYELGTKNIVDVVNSQRNLFQTQRDYLDKLYDYIINTLLLKEAAGTIQLSDLEALEQSLNIHGH